MSDEQIELSIDSDDEFEADYEDPGELRAEDVSNTVVYTLDWTVGTVVDQIDADPDDPESKGVLVTAPPFQRRSAWTSERQSLFIESLMLGLPIPPLVLAESVRHPGQFYVLDGKQRLTALRLFLREPDSPLKLSGLQLLATELNGKTWEAIRESSALRRYGQSMLSQPVRTIVVRNWRTPALLHLIFARLNKATVPLASHELRQALYPGKFTNFVNQASAESDALLRARRLDEPDFRLRDAETLLRFIGFKTNLPKYRGDLRDFLDRVMKGGNEHFPEIESDLRQIVTEMDAAIEATFKIFGDAAFLRYDADREKFMPRFNVAVFDLMTWHLSEPGARQQIAASPKAVKQAFIDLCKTDSVFAGYLTSTTKTASAVEGRIERWTEALNGELGLDLTVDSGQTSFLPIGGKARA